MHLKPLSLTLGLCAALASGGAALAAHWLKVDPKDPYGKEGKFHMMDVDGIVQDPVSGWIVGRFGYFDPAETNKAKLSTFLWVFDCKNNKVYFPDKTDWRTSPTDLSQPHMGGVTNTMARKLCALSGSWPEGALPS